MPASAARLSRLRQAASALAAILALTVTAPAQAQNLRAGYDIAIAGLSIGSATLSVKSAGQSYRLNLGLKLTGLAGALTGGKGAAEASGVISGAKPVPTSYAVTTSNGQASRTVRMALRGGSVAALEVKPSLEDFDDRVPVTAAQKVDVMDPVSALMMPAALPDHPLDPASCARKLAVFDGVARFDIVLSYARTDNVAIEGYSGPVIACTARYVPISGHRSSLKATAQMADNRELGVELAPIAGTRLLLPVKITVRTLIGMLVINATQFRREAGTGPDGREGAQR